MNIGKIIKEQRMEKKLTQEDLAKQFFVTRQLISKWENGKSYPDLDQVLKLSEFFGLSLDELLREDQAMLKELTFAAKNKKIFKGLLILLSIFLIGFISIFTFDWWVAGTALGAEDIQITQITKKILPKETITIEETGETYALPEDIEYTIHFTTDKWFINLGKLSGYKVDADETGILIQINGFYKLFGGNTESKVVIRSNRDLLTSDLKTNFDKDVYLYNREKLSKSYRAGNFKDGRTPVAEVGDKIASAQELQKLP